jgi:hypothetical protein
MPEFQVGDIVRVEMPRGYSMRGVLGISLLFSTSPEARFEGAIGTVTDINPEGPHAVHQYLVDFRTHDNGRVGIPWQAQWFREEWIALKERPEKVAAATSAQSSAESTWPERPVAESPPAGGIAHPEAKIFTEGRTDFAPPELDPNAELGSVPDSAYGISGRATERADASTGDSTSSVPGEQGQHESESGIAHPDANLFREGRKDFAPSGLDPEQATSAVPDSAEGISPADAGTDSGISRAKAETSPTGPIGSTPAQMAPTEAPTSREPGTTASGEAPQAGEISQAFTGAERADDRSAADVPAFEPTPEMMAGPVEATTPSSAPGTMGDTSEPTPGDLIVEQGDGFVRVQGMTVCPDGFPIKGNANSGIFHSPTDSSYVRTIPEICFTSEDVAIANGYRAPARRG